MRTQWICAVSIAALAAAGCGETNRHDVTVARVRLEEARAQAAEARVQAETDRAWMERDPAGYARQVERRECREAAKMHGRPTAAERRWRAAALARCARGPLERVSP